MTKNPLIAAYKRKVAELGALDNEIKSLDMTLPEGEGQKTFDYLAQKRQEIEQDIQGMQEKVQLLTAWSKFKEGPWSENLKTELDGMDQTIGDIAVGESSDPPVVPGLQGDMNTPPASGAESEQTPPAGALPEAPVPEAAPPPPIEGTTEVPPPMPPAPAQPMQASKKYNYQIPDKKGAKAPISERGKNMANEQRSSMKETIASVKANREAIQREAKTRVACAWTIAKTMLPNAPVSAQKVFAASLLTNKTSALKAALKQTAINAHYTKVAETFKEVHKVEMNDLLEDPSVLNKEKSAVKSELKGEAKAASPKQADDRKDSGPQPSTYSDGRGHGGGTASEPKELDAGKAAERPGAGERPGDTIDLSDGKSKAEGGDGAPKAAAKKKALAPPPPQAPPVPPAGPVAGAPPLDPAAGAPVEGGLPPEGLPDDGLGDGLGEEMPPEGGLPPEGLPPAGPEGMDAGAGDLVTEQKVKELGEKAEELATEIHQLEEAVAGEETQGDEVPEGVLENEGNDLEQIGNELEGEGDVVEGEGENLEGDAAGQELDLENIFNEGVMEEKTSALANEGDNSGSDFFTPSAAMDMEATLDDNGVQDFGDVVASYFDRRGADDDPLLSLMGGVRTAASVAGMEVLPAFDGSAAKHFEQKEVTSDARDSDADHKDDLWADVISDSEPSTKEFKDAGPGKGSVRVPQDSTNKLEGAKPGDTPEAQGKAAGKVAPKAPATLRKIKPVMASDKDAPKVNPTVIASALFSDGFDE